MDPSTGTFTSMDTYAGSLSDPISLHKYLFANSNPVMYSDPSGHYTLTEQETAIAIQAILGEAISGIVYIFDWFITDPDSKNHSIGKMIIAMMLGLAQSAVMGSWGGWLSSLISKAGMSVLDYLLTGIMFALFSGNLKLVAINLRDSGNFKVAAMCDAGGNFASFVSFSSFVNAFAANNTTQSNSQKSKTKIKNNKRGAIRIGGENNSEIQTTNGNNNTGQRPINRKGVEYPKVNIDGYGEVPFPEGPYTPNNAKELRPRFTRAYKEAFKKWWIDQGRPWPEGTVNIHHIKPLNKGGTNDFSNLVPVVYPNQHQPFTNWWISYP